MMGGIQGALERQGFGGHSGEGPGRTSLAVLRQLDNLGVFSRDRVLLGPRPMSRRAATNRNLICLV